MWAKQAVKNSLQIGAGTAVGTFLVLRMDDMVYHQLRRNVLFPIQVLMNAQKIEKEDLQDVGQGAQTFARQFRPLAMQKANPKQLLIDDHDYSSPQDHYFAYINKRNTGYTYDEDKEHNDQILGTLNLEEYMNPKNKNMIYGLNETLIQKEREERLYTPKHSKKDYAGIEKLGVKGIFNLEVTETKKVEYTEDKMTYKDMVKIQDKKKKFKQKEQKKKQKQLAKLLETPGQINSSEMAVDLYDNQPIKAGSLTNKDIGRLEMLKSKANASIEPEEQQIQNEVQIQEPKSQVRIEFRQASQSDGFEHEIALEKMEERGVFENVDSLDVEKFNAKIKAGEEDFIKNVNKPTLSDMMQRPADTRRVKDYSKPQGGQTEQRSKDGDRF